MNVPLVVCDEKSSWLCQYVTFTHKMTPKEALSRTKKDGDELEITYTLVSTFLALSISIVIFRFPAKTLLIRSRLNFHLEQKIKMGSDVPLSLQCEQAS